MNDKECFVIMPFSDGSNPADNRWDDLFEHNLKPAVEGAGLGYTCKRSHNPHGNFMHDILHRLANAEIAIAVLTELRPNVMYELGVRHALKRKTIMLVEEGSQLPSDLGNFITLQYTVSTQAGRQKLASTVRDRLAQLDAEEPLSDNPVSDYLWMRAQDVCNEWYLHRSPQRFMARLAEILPSYAMHLGRLLGQISNNLTTVEQTIRHSIASSEVAEEITDTINQGADEATKGDVARILSSAADKAIDTIRKSFLTIDTTPLLGAKGESWDAPYDHYPTVSDLLDEVWYSLHPHVPSMKYGVTWALRDAASRRVFREAGRTWAKRELGLSLDQRRLEAVGITPGMRLEAIPIK